LLVIFQVSTKLFSDLYPAKFLDTSAESFFPRVVDYSARIRLVIGQFLTAQGTTSVDDP